MKPIAHLYKSQVYALAEHLGIPPEIRSRTPTTDTYSLAQTQEEFYFALPHEPMDLCLWAVDHDVPAAEVAPVIGLTIDQVERVFRDIAAKRRAARYLHYVPAPLRARLSRVRHRWVALAPSRRGALPRSTTFWR